MAKFCSCVDSRGFEREYTIWSAFSNNRCKCTSAQHAAVLKSALARRNRLNAPHIAIKGDNCKNKNCTHTASIIKSLAPSHSNKTSLLDAQASLSFVCKMRYNNAKYCSCKKKQKTSCSNTCHPGHSCTNCDETEALI